MMIVIVIMVTLNISKQAIGGRATRIARLTFRGYGVVLCCVMSWEEGRVWIKVT